jgi:hypothetical protein
MLVDFGPAVEVGTGQIGVMLVDIGPAVEVGTG